MSLIAEFRLSSPQLALYETRQAVPDLRLVVEQEVGTNPERPLFFFWAKRGGETSLFNDVSPSDADGSPHEAVEGDDEVEAEFFEAVEDALDRDPTASDEVLLDRFPNRRLYRVQLTEAVGVLMYPKFVSLGAEQLYTVGTAEGWHTRMRFTDRDSLTEFRRYCVDRDVTFDLRRVYDETDDAADRFGLTQCQREAIEVALRTGYFEVPRAASLGDVAEQLGVSSQSASERLRRGMRTLAANAFGGENERQS